MYRPFTSVLNLHSESTYKRSGPSLSLTQALVLYKVTIYFDVKNVNLLRTLLTLEAAYIKHSQISSRGRHQIAIISQRF